MAQDGGIRSGTCNGAMDRCRESQGWTTACSSMPERHGKDQVEDIPKQAGSCWFARHINHKKWRELVSSGRFFFSFWFADAMLSFSGVTFVLCCFAFVFLLSLKPLLFVRSFFDMVLFSMPTSYQY